MGAWVETINTVRYAHDRKVASFMGAWVETDTNLPEQYPSVSHPLWVRGLKHAGHFCTQITFVASFMGAWVETRNTHPNSRRDKVASFMGAWVETIIIVDL